MHGSRNYCRQKNWSKNFNQNIECDVYRPSISVVCSVGRSEQKQFMHVQVSSKKNQRPQVGLLGVYVSDCWYSARVKRNMCVRCVYRCGCICMYMYVYVCICMYMYVYVCICMYIYVYLCICLSMSIYVCVCVCVYVCVCVGLCWEKNTHIHTMLNKESAGEKMIERERETERERDKQLQRQRPIR
jgi:hypothetical protein